MTLTIGDTAPDFEAETTEGRFASTIGRLGVPASVHPDRPPAGPSAGGVARRVAPVQHQGVAVGIAEDRHVADARVEDVALERHAGLLERRARLGDVGDAERDLRARVRREGPPDAGGIDESGGMIPDDLDRRPSGRFLSVTEREEIAIGWAGGESKATFARRIERHRSTIGPELALNQTVRRPPPAPRPDGQPHRRGPRPTPCSPPSTSASSRHQCGHPS